MEEKKTLSDHISFLEKMTLPVCAVTRGVWDLRKDKMPLGVLRTEIIGGLQYGPTLWAPRWRAECPLDMKAGKTFPQKYFLSALVMQTLLEQNNMSESSHSSSQYLAEA